MSFFDFLASIFPTLFGKNKQVQQAEQPKQSEPIKVQVPYNPNNVEGTNMRTSVFTMMVAGEKDPSQVENVKKQMQEMDAIGTYPYTITSAAWSYIITKPKEPEFTQYGTQYTAMHIHK